MLLTHRSPTTLPHDMPSVARQLDRYNRIRLTPVVDPDDALDEGTLWRMHALEVRFVEGERAKLRERAHKVPTDPDDFVRWFEELNESGPGQNDPLFPWLERHATREDFTWFLRQEVAGEAGFDDLVALSQIKMPPKVKLEMAHNYWDEMGQGHLSGMHGPMLARLAEELGIAHPQTDEVVWEPLALANLMVAMAFHRNYAYHSIGALGAIELTAPGRAARVNAGLKRLGIGGAARRYFALHATLDVQHSESWNREVLRPLVAQDGRIARLLAEGALMRLLAGERCFERYRSYLWGERSECRTAASA